MPPGRHDYVMASILASWIVCLAIHAYTETTTNMALQHSESQYRTATFQNANVVLHHFRLPKQMLHCRRRNVAMQQTNVALQHCNPNVAKRLKKVQTKIKQLQKRMKRLQNDRKNCKTDNNCNAGNRMLQWNIQMLQCNFWGKRALLEPEQLHSSKQNIAVQGTKCCSAESWRVRIMEEQGRLLTRARHHRCFLSL